MQSNSKRVVYHRHTAFINIANRMAAAFWPGVRLPMPLVVRAMGPGAQQLMECPDGVLQATGRGGTVKGVDLRPIVGWCIKRFLRGGDGALVLDCERPVEGVQSSPNQHPAGSNRSHRKASVATGAAAARADAAVAPAQAAAASGAVLPWPAAASVPVALGPRTLAAVAAKASTVGTPALMAPRAPATATAAAAAAAAAAVRAAAAFSQRQLDVARMRARHLIPVSPAATAAVVGAEVAEGEEEAEGLERAGEAERAEGVEGAEGAGEAEGAEAAEATQGADVGRVAGMTRERVAPMAAMPMSQSRGSLLGLLSSPNVSAVQIAGAPALAAWTAASLPFQLWTLPAMQQFAANTNASTSLGALQQALSARKHSAAMPAGVHTLAPPAIIRLATPATAAPAAAAATPAMPATPAAASATAAATAPVPVPSQSPPTLHGTLSVPARPQQHGSCCATVEAAMLGPQPSSLSPPVFRAPAAPSLSFLLPDLAGPDDAAGAARGVVQAMCAVRVDAGLKGRLFRVLNALEDDGTPERSRRRAHFVGLQYRVLKELCGWGDTAGALEWLRVMGGGVGGP